MTTETYLDNRDSADMANCYEAEVQALRARVKELQAENKILKNAFKAVDPFFERKEKRNDR